MLSVMLPSMCAAQMDKALHTSAGFGITISVTALSNKPKIGLLAGLSAGVGKELWDARQRGHDASARDCFATAAGSVSAFALWKLVVDRHRPVKIATAPTADTPGATAGHAEQTSVSAPQHPPAALPTPAQPAASDGQR